MGLEVYKNSWDILNEYELLRFSSMNIGLVIGMNRNY